jgi:hypothetical protein
LALLEARVARLETLVTPSSSQRKKGEAREMEMQRDGDAATFCVFTGEAMTNFSAS